MRLSAIISQGVHEARDAEVLLRMAQEDALWDASAPAQHSPVPSFHSACRAVWYCGIACSHADWREGGHRRMCKALAAARQAAKQQARQDAAEQGQ